MDHELWNRAISHGGVEVEVLNLVLIIASKVGFSFGFYALTPVVTFFRKEMLKLEDLQVLTVQWEAEGGCRSLCEELV